VLQRSSDSLSAKGRNDIKTAGFKYKKNIKAGALNNSYVLTGKVNKAVKKYFIYPVRFV